MNRRQYVRLYGRRLQSMQIRTRQSHWMGFHGNRPSFPIPRSSVMAAHTLKVLLDRRGATPVGHLAICKKKYVTHNITTNHPKYDLPFAVLQCPIVKIRISVTPGLETK